MSEGQKVTIVSGFIHNYQVVSWFFDFGNPSMKSMLMISHALSGISSGWRRPGSFVSSGLAFRQISHLQT